MKHIVAFALALSIFASSSPQAFTQDRPDVKLLAAAYPQEVLEDILIPREEWKPYPTIDDADGYDTIPAAVRQAYIREGEKLLDTEWAPLPATVFLEYVRNGNRSNYQALSFGRRGDLATLVLAELFEREGRFMDQIVNGIWAISEESFWGVPAHLGLQEAGPGLPDVTEPAVDLFAAETGALLAWTYYLLKPELDEISPLIAERIEYETDRRILTPFLERDDWGWMGFTWRNRTGYVRPVNNWNPWINSNVLASALILEKDPERRLAIIHKSMDSIDNFILPYPSDGGSDEGPSYWSRAGGSLFDCLDLLYNASGGEIDIFDQPLIKEVGRYVYRMYIRDNYFVNFADASAKIEPDPALVYRYGRAIDDATMYRFGAFLAELQDYGSGTLGGGYSGLSRGLPALFSLEELRSTAPAEPLLQDVWLKDIQVMTARDQEGTADGFYLAAKGGHNDESHNHNDVGNFIVYHDGKPVLVDAGAQTYTARTFSSERYELWNNQSAYHTLPTINGVMQKEGREFEARDVQHRADDRRSSLSLDIANAYPEEAGVESWYRTITLHRGDNMEVAEEYRLAEYAEPYELNFLTPLQPESDPSGRVRLVDPDTARSYSLEYDPERFSPEFEEIPIDDDRMSSSWGERLYRVVLMSQNDQLSDAFSIRLESDQ